MLDIETLLMALYMMSDGSSKYYLSAEASHPGDQATGGLYSGERGPDIHCCSALTQFIVLGKLPSGRGLTLSQAYQLLIDAMGIQAVLVCH